MVKVNRCNIKLFLILSSMIFVFLQFIFVPRIGVGIKSTMPYDVLWTATYENSNEKLPSLGAYDIMKESGRSDVDGAFDLTNVPIVTDAISLNFDSEEITEIREVRLEFYHVPLKIISGDALSSITHLGAEDVDLYLRMDIIADLLKWIIALFLGISLILGYYFSLVLPQLQKFMGALYLVMSPMLAFVTLETITSNIWFIGFRYRILNYIFYLLIYIILYIILSKITIRTFVYNVLFLIIGIANYYVLLFRGKPILPWDIYAISTAMNVASSYVLTLTDNIFYCTLLNVIFVLLTLTYKNQFQKEKRGRKALTIGILCPCLIGIVLGNKDFTGEPFSGWDTDIVYFYRTKGSFFSYVKYWADSRIKKPEGYNTEIWDVLESELPQEDISENEITPQNIIMIMNESLTDIDKISNKYIENTLPFMDSLSGSSIWGNLYVSVRGGSTCNTEFEALTGNSLVFLPPNTFPFQNYINDSIPSIASLLKSKGYTTEALHLEQGKNWNRNAVYPKLGFDAFYDINSYENVDTIRGRATDKYNYKQLINLVEKKTNEKLFVFNITIQNHGGYTGFKDLPKTLDLSSYGNFEEAEVFLSLLQMSDDAFRDLISYFSSVDEPTMIIMFGDHQPKLEERTEEFLLGESNSLESALNRYNTPFVIWKNYGNKSEYIEHISSNYLSSLILKEANIKLPVYNRFLLKLYEEFPVITLQGIIDKNGRYYTSIDEIAQNPLIKTYEALQYSILFD